MGETVDAKLAVAFMLIQDGKLLVEKRRANKRFLPNVLSIPGGHCEPGESAEETLAIIRKMVARYFPLRRMLAKMVTNTIT